MSSPRVLSPEEINEVKELKQRVQDLIPHLRDEYHKHDVHFVRYVRARDHNVEKAAEMFRKTINWRLANDVDHCLDKILPTNFNLDYPLHYTGRDKDGDVVGVLRVGKFDLRKNLDAGYRKEFMIYGMQSFDFGTNVTKSISTNDDYRFQTNIIADMDGFQFGQFLSKEAIELSLDIVRMLESNYPECLKSMVIVNAPKIFEILWALIRPLLTARSISKISIYGSNKEKWKVKLRDEIDPDSLPSEYGGAISYFPRAIYNRPSEVFPRFKMLPQEDLTTVVVPAGSTHDISLDILAGATLCWNFKTEQYDIGFRIQFDNIEDVVPYSRVDSHIYLQKGMFTCEHTGKYTLIFDNTFSAFTSKTLQLAVQTYS
ncbi:unnamed protein product [Allacma fusca]|uniref:CRAL-TRIO domain-containing protein n=1 Tax=Allacma fusca TaxID=39272 RepID=A0A8J2KF67_9HEXA|nr:unnamed protein product [Allacma fusca]